MQYKKLSLIEIFIIFFLVLLILSSIYFFYITQINTKNITTPIVPKITPTQIPTPTQDPIITCRQNGKIYYDGQKYVVTLISNYSDASWTILNNLNCTPLAGSGSIFNTSCNNLGSSTATVSFGGLQNTCQFTTIP